jgi:hypothetical protein
VDLSGANLRDTDLTGTSLRGAILEDADLTGATLFETVIADVDLSRANGLDRCTHERLLLILSQASMASEWVKTEIAKARQREVKEERRVLFPVRLVEFETLRDWECFDADTGKDSAREVRQYFITDFSRWKDHDAYQQAFDRLLRDLKKAADLTPGATDGKRSSQG